MTTFDRTHLSKPLKAQMAALAFAAQMLKGSISGVARAFEVSRPTVHKAADLAKQVLEDHFSRPKSTNLIINEPHILRAIVALRVLVPGSIRAIEHLIPILFPGTHIAYGKIHHILSQAEHKAQKLNETMPLDQVQAIAPDEMFSQGRPVLAAIDLDSGALVALQDADTRSQDDWVPVLQAAQEQGLQPQVIVKDAGTAIQAAVDEVYSEAQVRFDSFHIKRELGQVHTYLERKAYKAIAQEYALQQRQLKAVHRGQSHPRVRAGQIAAQKKKTAKALCRSDVFREQMERIFDALWVVDSRTGQLRGAAQLRAQLNAAVGALGELAHPRVKKVAKYVENRIGGLCAARRVLRASLQPHCERFGDVLVGFGCLFHRLVLSTRRSRNPWRRRELQDQRDDVFSGLLETLGPCAVELLNGVEKVLRGHHEASSAIEGFNAQLRPHLYVHKRVTRGFLELFRFAFNHRRRGLGRAKSASPYERLTGQVCEDWLEALGYPPSACAAA